MVSSTTEPLASAVIEPTIEYAAGTTWVFDDFSTADGELVVQANNTENIDGPPNVEEQNESKGEDNQSDTLDSFMQALEEVVDM